MVGRDLKIEVTKQQQGMYTSLIKEKLSHNYDGSIVN